MEGMEGREGETQVFVVRFWPPVGVGGAWRGQAEHVPSGKRTPIRDLTELQAFIEQQLQATTQAGDAEGDDC